MARGPSIKVHVGSGGLLYTLPVDLLCHHSPFFEASIHSNSKGALCREMFLPDTSPAFFEIFLHYINLESDIYTGLLQWHLKSGKLAAHLASMARNKLVRYLEEGPAAFAHTHHSVSQLHVELCMDFVRFCNQLDVGQVAEAAVGLMQEVLNDGNSVWIEAEDAIFVADVLHERSLVLGLFMTIGSRNLIKELQTGESHVWSDLMRSNKRVEAAINRAMMSAHPEETD